MSICFFNEPILVVFLHVCYFFIKFVEKLEDISLFYQFKHHFNIYFLYFYRKCMDVWVLYELAIDGKRRGKDIGWKNCVYTNYGFVDERVVNIHISYTHFVKHLICILFFSILCFPSNKFVDIQIYFSFNYIKDQTSSLIFVGIEIHTVKFVSGRKCGFPWDPDSLQGPTTSDQINEKNKNRQ